MYTVTVNGKCGYFAAFQFAAFDTALDYAIEMGRMGMLARIYNEEGLEVYCRYPDLVA